MPKITKLKTDIKTVGEAIKHLQKFPLDTPIMSEGGRMCDGIYIYKSEQQKGESHPPKGGVIIIL